MIKSNANNQGTLSASNACMTVVRRLATFLGLEKEKIFFISKLLDRDHVKVDGLLECLVDGVDRFVSQHGNARELLRNLEAVFRDAPGFLDLGFGSTISSVCMC